jgi:hypothetical protein
MCPRVPHLEGVFVFIFCGLWRDCSVPILQSLYTSGALRALEGNDPAVSVQAGSMPFARIGGL